MSGPVAQSSAAIRPGRGRLKRIRAALTPAEWRRVLGMAAVVLGLHAFGFLLLFAVVAPRNYELGASGIFGVGLGITAYTLGLRHAFDADHIGAIDNTTRKLMTDGQRPLSVGFFFSLGHSTIVFALGLLVVVGVRGLSGAVADDGSALHQATGLIGPTVSGTFLFVIGVLNLVVLVSIVRVFLRMRDGHSTRRSSRQQLDNRGLHEPLLQAGDERGPQAVAHVPARAAVRARLRHRDRDRAARDRRRRGGRRAAVLRDPLPADPVRGRDVAARHDRRRVHELRLRLGVLEAGPEGLLQHHDHRVCRCAVALVIGTIELLSVLADKLSLTGQPWDFVSGLDLNFVGYAIVGMFVLTWAVALAVWRFGRIEERWSARLREA